MNSSDLSNDVIYAWKDYYSCKFSIFTESMLINTDKVDLVAMAIAGTCYDEYIANKVVESFKAKLYYYLKSPHRVIDRITKSTQKKYW